MTRLLTVLVFGLWSWDAVSQELPEIKIDVAVQVAGQGRGPTHLTGRMTWRSSAPDTCFHVAYNDPDYGNSLDASRKLERLTEKIATITLAGGSTSVESHHHEKVWLRPHVFRVENSSEPVSLEFRSTMPLLPQFSGKDWYWEAFYPRPLARCPEPGETIEEFIPAIAHHQISISLPSGWDYAGQGELDHGSGLIKGSWTGKSWAFALSRRWAKHHFTAAGVKVELYFHSPDFLELEDAVNLALDWQTKALGEFPFPKLVIIETSENHKQGESGLITFNTPRQPAFKFLQSDFLNWRRWVATSFVATQWFGSSTSVSSVSDEWLLQGLVDVVAFDTLQAQPSNFDLFNQGRQSMLPRFSLNYQQVQNITAATLRRSAPYTVLTNSQWETLIPFHKQHPLQYVRHAMAIQQIRSFTGEPDFAAFLRRYARETEISIHKPCGIS